MKVTAIIDDKIIDDAMKYSNSSTIANALITTSKEYVELQSLKDWLIL